MKKTRMVAIAVVTLIIVAATAFTSCNKFEQDEKGIDGYPEIPGGVDSVKIAHQLLLEDESEYANGEIRFVCLDSVWAYKGGVSYPGTAKCKCIWSVDRRVLRDLPEDTCMTISATADPAHLIFGSNTVVALQTAELIYATVQVDGIEYSVKSQLFGHKCLTSPYRLCTSGDNVTFWGRGDDNDTVSAEGDRGRNVHDTVPIHHYDTVVVERHDTTVVVVYDTTFIVDTVTNDTVRFVVDSVVYSPHHVGESNLVFVSNTLRAECSNNIITTVYRDGQVYSNNTRNFGGLFDHLYSESGNYTTDHVGMALPINADGTVNWGNGFSQSFQHVPHYTNPTGYEAWLRYLDCDFVRDSVYGLSNGILFVGHYVCPNGQHRKTYFFPKTPQTPQDTTTRRIIGRDTNWSCGSVTSDVVSSNSLTHNITRTGVETVHYNLAPLTVTHNLTQNGAYVDSYTYSGTTNPAFIGTTVPVTFTATGLSFTIGTATWTLTMGPQAFCQLQYGATVTLTANGPELSWTYNGQVGYDTIGVNWYHPLTGKRVIDAWASYAYTSNTAAPEEWYVLYTEDLATGQRYFEYIPHTTGYITYSASIVSNTTSISASDTTAIRSQINAGRYGARVYNHNSTSHQWLPGFTHAVQNGSSTSTSWTVTYWFCSGTVANHVDLIVGTTDVNSGNSRRGRGNGTYVEADDGRLYY